MNISVTKTDIKYGIVRNTRSCPVARAIARQIGKGIKVRHGFMIGKRGKRIKLPPSAVVFIDLFDNGLPVQPFRFKLKLKSRCDAKLLDGMNDL